MKIRAKSLPYVYETITKVPVCSILLHIIHWFLTGRAEVTSHSLDIVLPIEDFSRQRKLQGQAD